LQNDNIVLTADQIRAARALLDWSQPKLAEASGLSLPTIRRMEGPIGPGRSSAALDEAGVIFLDAGETTTGGPGVRLKS
jgi:transcriptional regulator with XRE-family HTH domain